MPTDTRRLNGHAVRALRIARQMTQLDLAVKIGSHPSTIAHWEADRWNVSPESQQAIALALGVSIDSVTYVASAA